MVLRPGRRSLCGSSGAGASPFTAFGAGAAGASHFTLFGSIGIAYAPIVVLCHAATALVGAGAHDSPAAALRRRATRGRLVAVVLAVVLLQLVVDELVFPAQVAQLLERCARAVSGIRD